MQEIIHLRSWDYLVVGVYLLLVALLSVLFRASRFNEMFGEARRPGWLLLAASLLMIEWSPMTDMMSMGLIIENGYSGLWLLKSRFWLAGVPAILFATMWSRLDFKTDNELIRLRFSGRSGIILHIFRAVFLAVFVIPLFGSFIILSMRKLLDVLQPTTLVSAESLLVLLVLLLTLKNSFRQKIRTDGISALICLLAPVLICYFLLQAYGGSALYQDLSVAAGEKTLLIPTSFSRAEPGIMGDFLVFLFIQWWSVNIVDNSDPNAQRHFQATSQFAAFRTLFLPILITSLMFLFVSTIWDCGLLEYSTRGDPGMDNEAFYLRIALQYLPDGVRGLVLIAILFSFVTTLEAIINWGGGLITVDILKTYLLPRASDNSYRLLSVAAMLLVTIISLLFAFNSDRILSLQKFVFSISAGVAPVFMLRWFWWRINGWTQISAMLSSLVYTLVYDYFYQHSQGLRDVFDNMASALHISAYPFKVSLLTALVVATWLAVMYRTSPDDREHLQRFVEKTGTGGIWPNGFPDTGYHLKKRLMLCLLLAITSILPFIFIWQFKFGSTALGCWLVVLFLALASFVYYSMRSIVMPDAISS